ncbi:hypothetical protein H4R35_004763 [Dimargaris xerosporica]|nr:hypothetical protein H4R35_004763 [Dimargaris xerosporica]
MFTQGLCIMPASPAKPTPPAVPALKRLVIFTDNLMKFGANAIRSHKNSGARQELVQAIDDSLCDYQANANPCTFPVVGYDHISKTLTVFKPGSPAWQSASQVAALTPVSGAQSQCSSASSSPSLTPLSQGQIVSYPPGVLNHQQRNDAKVAAKLYLLERTGLDPAVVAQSVSMLCQHLGLVHIDHLVVSFNEPRHDYSIIDNGSQVTWPLPLEQMLDIWHAMEQEVAKGRVGNLGVCEFTPTQLTLFSARTKVAPTINQISINPQAPVPQQLLRYCQKYGIDLQNNVDGTDIVTPQDMHRVSGKLGLEQTTDQSLTPTWVIKYHTLLHHRAVVVNKGYIVCAQ